MVEGTFNPSRDRKGVVSARVQTTPLRSRLGFTFRFQVFVLVNGYSISWRVPQVRRPGVSIKGLRYERCAWVTL